MGGILNYGFCKFILDISIQNNFNHLFFIARDGFIQKKVFDLFNQKRIKTYYLYAERILKVKCLQTYDPERIDLNLSVLKSEFNKIKKDFPIEFNSYEEKEKFINSNKDITNKIAEQTKKEYLSYFNNLISNEEIENIILIDSSTGKFSAQKLISYILNKETIGIYLEADSEYGEKNKIKNFKYRKDEKIGAIITLIEFLMQSPEPPIEDIKDFKPVYQNHPHQAEVRRNYIYNFIAKGIINFSNDIILRLNKFQIPISISSINNIILSYETNMNKLDKKMFSSVFCPTSDDHTTYDYSLLKLIDIYKDKDLKSVLYILSFKFLSIIYYKNLIKIKLFDLIPVFYIKNNKIKLFNFITLIKIKVSKNKKSITYLILLKLLRLKNKIY